MILSLKIKLSQEYKPSQRPWAHPDPYYCPLVFTSAFLSQSIDAVQISFFNISFNISLLLSVDSRPHSQGSVSYQDPSSFPKPSIFSGLNYSFDLKYGSSKKIHGVGSPSSVPLEIFPPNSSWCPVNNYYVKHTHISQRQALILRNGITLWVHVRFPRWVRETFDSYNQCNFTPAHYQDSILFCRTMSALFYLLVFRLCLTKHLKKIKRCLKLA